jgi:hypothetical protein
MENLDCGAGRAVRNVEKLDDSTTKTENPRPISRQRVF